MLFNRFATCAFLLGLIGGPSFADDIHCSQINGNAERSACYAGLPDAAKSKPSRDWLVMDSKSANSVVVIRTASQEVKCGDKVGTFTLALMCKDDRTSYYVSAGCQLGETGDQKKIAVRIDDSEPTVEKATIPRNTFVLRADEDDAAIRFMKSLLGKEWLDIGVTPPSHPQFTAGFDLAGLPEKIEPLRKACAW